MQHWGGGGRRMTVSLRPAVYEIPFQKTKRRRKKRKRRKKRRMRRRKKGKPPSMAGVWPRGCGFRTQNHTPDLQPLKSRVRVGGPVLSLFSGLCSSLDAGLRKRRLVSAFMPATARVWQPDHTMQKLAKCFENTSIQFNNSCARLRALFN